MPKQGDLKEQWWVVDAEGQVLGRLAARIAAILRGKHRPTFTPHSTGDFVVVTNADKIVLTGKKWTDKKYHRHTGWPGGIRETTPQQLAEKRPEEILRMAVWGMLPKNRLGRRMFKRLRVFAGPDHPHQAQKPQPLPLHTRQSRKEE